MTLGSVKAFLFSTQRHKMMPVILQTSTYVNEHTSVSVKALHLNLH